MTKKPKPPVTKPDIPVFRFDEATAKKWGGSDSTDFNLKLLEDTLPCVWMRYGDDPADRREKTLQAHHAVVAALMAFEPKDEIEGMIASQAVALHGASMECMRRAMMPEQSFEVTSRLRKDGANLARAMTDMVEALDRKRGKGPQVVRVERVVVHEGGQAVVGNVTSGSVPPTAASPLPIERGSVPMELMAESGKARPRGVKTETGTKTP